MQHTLNYESLPSIGRSSRRSTRDVERSTSLTGVPTSRRTFFRITGTLGAIVGVGALFGNLRVPAAGAAQVCTATLTFRNDCNGDKYVSCSGGRLGCARVGADSSSVFCLINLFGSRHKTCSENSGVNKYYYRTNACYDSTSDGWLWTDNQPTAAGCSCAAPKKRATWCKDGYTSTNSGVSYRSTICETFNCG